MKATKQVARCVLYVPGLQTQGSENWQIDLTDFGVQYLGGFENSDVQDISDMLEDFSNIKKI